MTHKFSKIFKKVPSQSRSIELVGSVFTAAYQMLSRESVAVFNSKNIASKAGVGIGSLYDYFYSKEGLLRYVVEKEIENNLRHLDELLSRETPASAPEAVDLLVSYFFEFAYQKKGLILNLLFAIPREVVTPLLARSRWRAAQRIDDWLKTRFPDFSVEESTQKIFFIVNQVLDSVHSYATLEKEDLPRLSRETIVQELRRSAAAVLFKT